MGELTMNDIEFTKSINSMVVSQDDVFVVDGLYLKIDKDIFNIKSIGTYIHLYLYDVLGAVPSIYQIVKEDEDGIWVKYINEIDYTDPSIQWTKKVNGKELRIYESNFNTDRKYGKYYIDVIDDVDENAGGFYIEIFEDVDRNKRVDYFCIHPDELEQDPDISIHIFNYINSL